MKKNKYKQKQIKQTAAHNKVAAGRQMAVSAVVAGPVGRRPQKRVRVPSAPPFSPDPPSTFFSVSLSQSLVVPLDRPFRPLTSSACAFPLIVGICLRDVHKTENRAPPVAVIILSSIIILPFYRAPTTAIITNRK